ncbi:MAG: carbohydrate kinase family protein [Candidatus Niyogibacteria bacterium]|nr:carbohydrate kinase family protein [Candidatus Niyogibacteria bacterium]
MRFDVITIGSATRDTLVKSKGFKIMESGDFATGKALAVELGSKIGVDEVFYGTGGAATNTATTFARQGFKTAFIARVGDDVLGRAVADEMEKEGVGVEWLLRDAGTPTGYSVILEHESGERTILAYRGANEKLRHEDIPWGDIPCAWIYLSSLSGDLGIAEAALEGAGRCGARVIWNPGGSDLALGFSALQPFLKRVNVFIVNQEEASKLLDIPYDDVNAIFKKFDDAIDGIAVMTRGPEGVYASDGTTLWKAGIFPEKKVADRTGAGDAFGSGFVAGLAISNGDVAYALRLGSANATSKVEHMGAKGGLLTRQEFEEDPRWKNLAIEETSL